MHLNHPYCNACRLVAATQAAPPEISRCQVSGQHHKQLALPHISTAAQRNTGEQSVSPPAAKPCQTLPPARSPTLGKLQCAASTTRSVTTCSTPLLQIQQRYSLVCPVSHHRRRARTCDVCMIVFVTVFLPGPVRALPITTDLARRHVGRAVADCIDDSAGAPIRSRSGVVLDPGLT